jgi:abortive infection bacteriophage resistance protein
MSGPYPLSFPPGVCTAGPLISGAMVYSKPAISVQDQIKLLRSRGLSIPDTALAEHFLRNVSYYRLEGYWWTLQVNRHSKRHRFRRGATFQQVIDRYDFDRELRLITLDMIERIEIAVRTRMIYHLSLKYKSHWHEDVKLVQNTAAWSVNLKRIKRDTRKSSETYLRAHYKRYKKDTRTPPSWKALEIVTVGTLSKMYANLKPHLPEKDLIANEVGLPDQAHLENWLHSVAVVRNIAAHHNRLFERTISVVPAGSTPLTGKWIDVSSVSTQSVYYHLSRMAYLLQYISPNNRFALRLTDLFAKHKATVRFKEVGFPANWRNQPIWR